MSAYGSTIDASHRSFASLDELYVEAERLDVTPGWIKRPEPIFWREPRTSFVPFIWNYESVKAALACAGTLVDVELAERRNLVLRNPFPENNFATVRTLVCAYQMILPGEVAPSHRHSSHALRVILDAAGSYSIVAGEKTPMESGDIVLTPGGHWHGHGHDGDVPAYWLDGLDIPSVHLMESMFFEEHPAKFEAITKVSPRSPYRFAADDIERLLDVAVAEPDFGHGKRVALAAPDMPAMGLSVERLSGGATRPQRSTANRIFVVMQGHGTTEISEKSYAWQRGDTFVAPTWTRFSHRADGDAVLFCLSDEPLMRACNYYRAVFD